MAKKSQSPGSARNTKNSKDATSINKDDVDDSFYRDSVYSDRERLGKTFLWLATTAICTSESRSQYREIPQSASHVPTRLSGTRVGRGEAGGGVGSMTGVFNVFDYLMQKYCKELDLASTFNTAVAALDSFESDIQNKLQELFLTVDAMHIKTFEFISSINKGNPSVVVDDNQDLALVRKFVEEASAGISCFISTHQTHLDAFKSMISSKKAAYSNYSDLSSAALVADSNAKKRPQSSSGKKTAKTKMRRVLRSRNGVINDWLREDPMVCETDSYADLEDFLVP